MDHEAWENEMIESFNRGDETQTKTKKDKWSMVMNKNDARTVAIGLKRTLLALLTLMMLAASIFGFIVVASLHGYVAVGIFFASVLGTVIAFILLYAQGITKQKVVESQGESK